MCYAMSTVLDTGTENKMTCTGKKKGGDFEKKKCNKLWENIWQHFQNNTYFIGRILNIFLTV